MDKLLVLSNFSFCHNVFNKASAAEASESFYMRERLKPIHTYNKSAGDDFENIQMKMWIISIN